MRVEYFAAFQKYDYSYKRQTGNAAGEGAFEKFVCRVVFGKANEVQPEYEKCCARSQKQNSYDDVAFGYLQVTLLRF